MAEQITDPSPDLTARSSRRRQFEFRRTRGQQKTRDAGANESTKKPDKVKRRKYLREYTGWLWPYRFSLAVLFLLALITAGLDMIWPLAIKGVIDGILLKTSLDLSHKRRLLNLLGFGIIAVLLLKQALDLTRSYRTSVLDAKVVVRLRRRLFEKLLGLSLGDLSDLKTGGIVSRLGSDVDSISGLVQMALISPGVAILRVILTIVILVALSWRLAIAALVLIPPMAALSILWLRKVRPIYRSAQQDRTEIDARTNETFGGIRVVRSFRREPREEKSYALGRHLIIRKGLMAQRLEMILEGGWGLLIPFTSLMIVWFGGYLVLRQQAKVGDIFAFQIYAVLLLQPVWQIVASISQTQKSLAAMERVFDVLAMPLDKPDASGAVDAPAQVREMRFDSVGFEYRPGVPVIQDFTLSVPGGSTVALVGPSGAGKTTLTDLIARFQDPTQGAILLNGIDLRQIKLAGYRSLLAVVQQETFLFDGSVRENIAYGRRGATDADIENAARRANAHGFITQLPNGYDTTIGERGFKLSGGQKQRLSIARAILADPHILILDEATSNLDTESEQLIQASLAELFKGRTTFVIAHRLSTVTHADLIVAMEQGRIVEAGSHEALMASGGFYHAMVERQRQSFGTLDAVLE